MVSFSVCKFPHRVCPIHISDTKMYTAICRLKGGGILKKIPYYLWRSSFSSQEAYEQAKRRLSDMGFRVIAFIDGPDSRPIQEGIRAVIRNHL